MRTPEEIKKGLECCHTEDCDLCDCAQCPYAVKKSFTKTCDVEMGCDTLDYIEQLEAKVPKWISVEERLPEVSVRLLEYEYSAGLLAHDGEHMYEAYYCHTTKMWHDVCDEDHIIDVTHWMPLPEPPEGDKKW